MDAQTFFSQNDIRFSAVRVKDMRFDASFAALCKANACGFYGRCYCCPPDAGKIDGLIARARAFSDALVFETEHTLADAFDIDGMRRASRAHNAVCRRVRDLFLAKGTPCLALGAGACGFCEVCAKTLDEPCVYPNSAILSLEVCGVDAAHLTRLAGFSLKKQENTVRYIGAVLY